MSDVRVRFAPSPTGFLHVGGARTAIYNYFFANGKVYYCGNCIDLPPIGPSGMTFEELEKIRLDFDRNYCYKETICG